MCWLIGDFQGSNIHELKILSLFDLSPLHYRWVVSPIEWYLFGSLFELASLFISCFLGWKL